MSGELRPEARNAGSKRPGGWPREAMVLTCQDCGRQYWLSSGEQQWLARKCMGSSRNLRCVQCEAAGIPASYHGVRLDIGLDRKPARPQSAAATSRGHIAERLPYPVSDFDSASQQSSVAWNRYKLGYVQSTLRRPTIRARRRCCRLRCPPAECPICRAPAKKRVPTFFERLAGQHLPQPCGPFRRHTDYGRLPLDQPLVSGMPYIPIGDDLELPEGEVRGPTPRAPPI